jgi:L-aspartate oxidase
MARDVVFERGVVAQPERRHAGYRTASVNAGRSDVVVVGAGAAGLFACLCAAREGARVALVSARPLAETASYWAQGGLAAALAVDDSPERHLQDTIEAGRGLVRRSAAEVLTEEAPARFRDLEALGVRFDADRHGNLALGLEGGHSRRRIVHAGGAATGRRITRALSALAAVHDRIEVLEPAAATALLRDEGRCVGLVARSRGRERTTTVLARAVILATGGMAALWQRTTNPRGVIGAGDRKSVV